MNLKYNTKANSKYIKYINLKTITKFIAQTVIIKQFTMFDKILIKMQFQLAKVVHS